MNKGAKMSLSEQLKKDIVAAMKGKEEMRLSVLRMAKAALQLKEVEKLRPLDETESIQLLQTLVKQRKESIEQFAKGGRQDLVDKENAELKFLEAYLPAGAQMFSRRDTLTKTGTVCGGGPPPAKRKEIEPPPLPSPAAAPPRRWEPKTAPGVFLKMGGAAQPTVGKIPRHDAAAKKLFA